MRVKEPQYFVDASMVIAVVVVRHRELERCIFPDI